jgi:hypothetical protein
MAARRRRLKVASIQLGDVPVPPASLVEPWQKKTAVRRTGPNFVPVGMEPRS